MLSIKQARKLFKHRNGDDKVAFASWYRNKTHRSYILLFLKNGILDIYFHFESFLTTEVIKTKQVLACQI